MIPDFLETPLLDNALWRWIAAPFLALILLLVLRLIRNIIGNRLGQLAERTSSMLDDTVAEIVKDTRSFLIGLLAIALAATLLDFGERYAQIMRTIALAALFIQIAIWANRLFLYFLQAYFDKRGDTRVSGRAAISTLGFLIKVVVWSVAILLILDNAPGVEINSLIASLGIAGVAGALAVQNILGDLFASLSIIFDQPFSVGDYITFGDLKGTVERIGLKSTRIRSLFGEELIVSNSDLLQSDIHNYRDLAERRYAFDVAVSYETPVEKLEAIPAILEEIARSVEYIRFTRATLRELGDSAILFEVETFVTVSDYTIYMKAREQINLKILRRFGEEGIEFPYPTYMVYHNRVE